MPISNEDASLLIEEWVSDPALRVHLEDVGRVMGAAAIRFGGESSSSDTWTLAGRLHDADWQLDPHNHPKRIVGWLREHGENDLADAVATHNTEWGIPGTPMGKSLVAFDELTGFIGAVAKVNPAGITGVSVSSVLKKLKRPSFAASVERSEVAAGAELLNLPIEDVIAFVLDVLCNN